MTINEERIDPTGAKGRSWFDIGYFHQKPFFLLASLTGAAAWLWIVVNHQTKQLSPEAIILLLLGLFGAGFLIYTIYKKNICLATYLFLIAQSLFITTFLWLKHDPMPASVFVLVIAMAGALAGPKGAFSLGGGVVLIELGLYFFAPEILGSLENLISLLLQAGLAAIVSGLAALGLYEALDAAEINAHQARQHAESARHHRAELVRTLKSLDLVNHQLTRANAELFQTREIIDAALRFKRKFAAQISHELLTSLNLILGFSETIAFSQHAYGTPLPKAYLRDVTEIHRNSRHLLDLIDDILDLSKLEAGRLGLHKEAVNIGTILHEAIEIVHPLMETKGLHLRQVIPRTLPPLMLDSARVRQVLLNLLGNAARITAEGGSQSKAR